MLSDHNRSILLKVVLYDAGDESYCLEYNIRTCCGIALFNRSCGNRGIEKRVVFLKEDEYTCSTPSIPLYDQEWVWSYVCDSDLFFDHIECIKGSEEFNEIAELLYTIEKVHNI